MDQQSKWLTKVPAHIGWYLAGFTDGEGSFNVSLKRDRSYAMRWQVEPSFNVSQRDRVILALLKRYLGCGKIRTRRDGVMYYEVRNLHALKERVIPFFRRFRFFSAQKKRNFALFCQIVELMDHGAHLTKEGLMHIVEIRESLNEGRGRKRKYTKADLVS